MPALNSGEETYANCLAVTCQGIVHCVDLEIPLSRAIVLTNTGTVMIISIIHIYAYFRERQFQHVPKVG